MTKALRIQALLEVSKGLPTGVADLSIGRYRVASLPSSRSDTPQALLEFTDTFESDMGGGSNPEEEVELVCNFLSVIYEMRVTKLGVRISEVDVPTQERAPTYPRFKGVMPGIDSAVYLQRLETLPIDLARQYARACRAYRAAIDLIPMDPTFAFFLLVVAVECLCSQKTVISDADLPVDKMKCERFCRFLSTYALEGRRNADADSQPLFTELLKTVYYVHRSGFVHGGKEVSGAALMADRAGVAYFKHATSGAEEKTTGLDWFAGTVRRALVNFLTSQPVVESSASALLPRLASEKAVLRLKVKRNVLAGEAVTVDDIDFQ